MLHKTRELLVKQRTMAVNALRGHLAEFGIVAAKGAASAVSMNCWRWRRWMPHFRLLRGAAVACMAQHLEGLDLSIETVDEEDRQGAQCKIRPAACLMRFQAWGP